jgi:hypothetical protein
MDRFRPEEVPMQRQERDLKKKEEAPRTDLPPAREPYYKGYFGTDEEEGVEREREAPDAGTEGEAEERNRR